MDKFISVFGGFCPKFEDKKNYTQVGICCFFGGSLSKN
jgi:hypothetical protein